MNRVVISEIPENAGRDIELERSILGPDVVAEHFACDGDEKRLVAACKKADAILTDYSPFTRPVLEQLPKCKLISVAATGYDNVDLAAATELGVRVCAIDEYCTGEVADHAILLMLALCRRLPEYLQQVQSEHRWAFDSLTGLARMSDLTLGIIGFGRIGQAIAQRAAGFGMAIVAQDPFPDTRAADRLGVRFCELPELCATSDIISLNCGLTGDNSSMIDAKMIQQMKKGPVLINCARGALVDEAALVQALDSGQISAAGLDVLSDESPDLETHPLIGRSNVILTPHVAFYSDASIEENRRVSASNIRNFLDGKHENVRRYVA